MHSSSSPGIEAAVVRLPRASTVDLIAAELRAAIYSGALPVGTQIGEVEISSQLGVSRSPLREAAQRLVQERLLTATPGRGLRVSVIGKEGLQDLYDARCAIEGEAIRLIVRNRADLGPIDTALRELIEASEGTDARPIGDADLNFHRILVDASGNTRLRSYFSTLMIETRIASYSMAEGYVVRRDLPPSYQQIVEALRAGDAAGATTALEAQMAEAVARLSGELAERGVEVETVQEPPTMEPPTLGPLSIHEE